MEVQGAYFRGCYVALIGIVRAAIHLTDAPSASTCFTKAGNYLQIFIHIFFWEGGTFFRRAGTCLTDSTGSIGGIPLYSIVRFSELIQCKVGNEKFAAAFELWRDERGLEMQPNARKGFNDASGLRARPMCGASQNPEGARDCGRRAPCRRFGI